VADAKAVLQYHFNFKVALLNSTTANNMESRRPIVAARVWAIKAKAIKS